MRLAKKIQIALIFFVFRAFGIPNTTFSTAWARRIRWGWSQLDLGLLGRQRVDFLRNPLEAMCAIV